MLSPEGEDVGLDGAARGAVVVESGDAAVDLEREDMTSPLTLPIIHSCLNSSAYISNQHSPITLKWGIRRGQHLTLFDRNTKNRLLHVLANPNASAGTSSSGREIIMVDPLEAKRLAAKQMEEIKAEEKLKRRRQIEAINGAWAMIGLTTGLIIEGQTGNGILSQLAGYWGAIVHIFVR